MLIKQWLLWKVSDCSEKSVVHFIQDKILNIFNKSHAFLHTKEYRLNSTYVNNCIAFEDNIALLANICCSGLYIKIFLLGIFNAVESTKKKTFSYTWSVIY
jgi:hypothetical protein